MEFNIKFDEKMIAETASKVLDEYEYNGKTIREWADLIINPKTNIDRIRSMSDEKLAVWIAETSNCSDWCKLNERCSVKPEYECCVNVWLSWLKEEVSDEN